MSELSKSSEKVDTAIKLSLNNIHAITRTLSRSELILFMNVLSGFASDFVKEKSIH